MNIGFQPSLPRPRPQFGRRCSHDVVSWSTTSDPATRTRGSGAHPAGFRSRLLTRICGSGLILVLLFLTTPALQAYDIPEVRQGRFQSDEVGLLPIEREKLATQLAAFVINHHSEGVIESEPIATTMAERLLALALHLDPRNRTALVADFQFRRGVAPEKSDEGYDAAVLANLLVTRARFLVEQQAPINQELTLFFLAAAMDIDPRNEDAVYQYLLLRRDGHEADWTELTGEREEVAAD